MAPQLGSTEALLSALKGAGENGYVEWKMDAQARPDLEMPMQCPA